MFVICGVFLTLERNLYGLLWFRKLIIPAIQGVKGESGKIDRRPSPVLVSIAILTVISLCWWALELGRWQRSEGARLVTIVTALLEVAECGQVAPGRGSCRQLGVGGPQGRVLGQCFWNMDVHVNRQGILLKCRF